MRYLSTLFFAVIILGYYGVHTVYASTIKVESDFSSFHVGDVFSVDILVDTKGATLNAAEIEMTFPGEFLEYQDYNDGDSVMNLWIQKPVFASNKIIHFSGVTPGGFSGDNQLMLSVDFKVTGIGQGNIELGSTSLLLHDGLGTADVVSRQNLHITSVIGPNSLSIGMVDNESPERFLPQIVQDPDLFEGNITLIFSTEDKGVGLDRFEVREGLLGRYMPATSPYKLESQIQKRNIYVRAIDKNGNSRVEIIYPQNNVPLYEQLGLVVSIIILCVLSISILLKKYRKV